jgi:hypothetical protein
MGMGDAFHRPGIVTVDEHCAAFKPDGGAGQFGPMDHGLRPLSTVLHEGGSTLCEQVERQAEQQAEAGDGAFHQGEDAPK